MALLFDTGTAADLSPDAAALRQEVLDTLHEFATDRRSMTPPRRRRSVSASSYFVTAPSRSEIPGAAPRARSRWDAAHDLALALG